MGSFNDPWYLYVRGQVVGVVMNQGAADAWLSRQPDRIHCSVAPVIQPGLKFERCGHGSKVSTCGHNPRCEIVPGWGFGRRVEVA